MPVQVYVPPHKPIDEYTPAERRAWLDNHLATAGERQKKSDRFYRTAMVSLSAAFIFPILCVVAALIYRSISN